MEKEYKNKSNIMLRGSLIILIIHFAHVCVAQFSVEIGVPSMHNVINSNFSFAGAYTKIGYEQKKFDYSILGSTASITNNVVNEKSLGATAEYLMMFEKYDWIKIKPGLMVMYTRSIKDNRFRNNNMYTLGPSIGAEIKVYKGLCFNTQSALMYGYRDYDNLQIQRENWGYHFPILLSLGAKYTRISN